MVLVFPVETIVMSGQKPVRDILYEPFVASDRINSLIGRIFNSISNVRVGALENVEKITRHASL